MSVSAGAAVDPGWETMLFLPYTPRDDAAALGFEDWVREVDNPFWNAVPGIAHYDCWKTVAANGPLAGFTYFDFMYLESPDVVRTLWAIPEVAEFAASWTRRWGRVPTAGPDDMERNYWVLECRRTSARGSWERSDRLLLELGPVGSLPAAGPPQSEGVLGSSLWHVETILLGAPEYEEIALTCLDVSLGHRSVATSGAEICAQVWGERYASPDHR